MWPECVCVSVAPVVPSFLRRLLILDGSGHYFRPSCPNAVSLRFSASCLDGMLSGPLPDRSGRVEVSVLPRNSASGQSVTRSACPVSS